MLLTYPFKFFRAMQPWLSLLGMLASVSCHNGCNLPVNDSAKLIVRVVQTTLKEPDHQIILTIQNEAKQAEAGLDLSLYKLVASIASTPSAKNSQLVCKPQEGDAIQCSSISKNLAHLVANPVLAGQDQELVRLNILPDEGVSELTIRLQIEALDTDQPIETQDVKWLAQLPQLSLGQVQTAVGTHAGHFTLQVTKKALDPTNVIVQIKSNQEINFQWNNREASQRHTLADLLNSTERIPAETTIGPIYYQIHQAKGISAADITLRCIQANQDILVGDNQLKWIRPDIRLHWNMPTYQAAPTKEIHYTITNQGADPVSAADKVQLRFTNITNNAAAIVIHGQALKQGEIVLQAYDFKDGIAQGILPVDLQEATQADFKLNLLVGGEIVGPPYVITCKQDIQLRLLPIIQDKQAPTQIYYKVQNEGTDPAQGVLLQYKSQAMDKAFNIGGNKLGKIQLGTIPAKTDHPGEFKGELGNLDFQTAPLASFEFMLVSNGVELPETTQKVDFKAKDLQLSVDTLNYDAATDRILYTITKAGVDALTADDHISLAYWTSNQATLDKMVQQEIPFDQAILDELNQGAYQGELALDFKDVIATQVSLVLKQKGQQVKNIATCHCQESVNPNFLNYVCNPTTHSIEYQLANTGQKKADKKYLGLQVKNHAKTVAQFNGSLFQAGEAQILQDVALIGQVNLLPNKNNMTGKLQVTINPLNNPEALFTLQVTYKGQLMGQEKKIWIQQAPMLELSHDRLQTVPMGDALQKQVTFYFKNTTGRDLQLADLQKITLAYRTSLGTGSLKEKDGYNRDIHGLDLADLGISNLAINEIGALQLVVDNSSQTQFDITLQGTQKPVVYHFKPNLPTIRLTVIEDKSTGIFSNTRKLTFHIVSDRNLGMDELEKIKVYYQATHQPDSIRVNISQSDIQHKNLYLLLGKGLQANQPVRVEVVYDKLKKGDQFNIAKLIISLVGTLESDAKIEIKES